MTNEPGSLSLQRVTTRLLSVPRDVRDRSQAVIVTGAPEVDYDERYRQKFSRVDDALDSLHDKLLERRGIWIFQRHKYPREQILKLPEFRKAQAVIRKVGADVMAWNDQGALSREELAAYQRARSRAARRLNTLRNAVRNRKATRIEKFIEILGGVIDSLIDLLPTLAKLAKAGLKLLAAKASPLLLTDGS